MYSRTIGWTLTSLSFLSGLLPNLHAAAQSDYANRQSGNRRYASGTESRASGGRGRARRGGDGRHGRDGRGRGRGGGRGGSGMEKHMNGVDVSDPHRNFTSEE